MQAKKGMGAKCPVLFLCSLLVAVDHIQGKSIYSYVATDAPLLNRVHPSAIIGFRAG